MPRSRQPQRQGRALCLPGTALPCRTGHVTAADDFVAGEKLAPRQARCAWSGRTSRPRAPRASRAGSVPLRSRTGARPRGQDRTAGASGHPGKTAPMSTSGRCVAGDPATG